MANFFLSSRTADDSPTARIIADAMTVLFGGENVFHDSGSVPSDVDFPAELKRRLENSQGLIVVIGAYEHGGIQDWLDDPSDVVRQEMETARKLRMPIFPVLVDRAWPPREADLPSSWPPGDRYLRVHEHTVDADLRHLIGYLATRFDVGFVQRGSDRVVLPIRLPSRDDYGFTAFVAVDFRVTDLTQVARQPTGEAVPSVHDFLFAVCEPITRRFGIAEISRAETAINEQLHRVAHVSGGITVHAAHAYLRAKGIDRAGSARVPGSPGRRAAPRRGPGSPDRRAAPRRGPDYLEPKPELAWPYTPTVTSRPASPPPVPFASSPAREPERLLVARAPTQVPVGQDLSVDVRLITRGRPFHPDSATSPLANLVVGENGTPVTVTVHAPRDCTARVRCSRPSW